MKSVEILNSGFWKAQILNSAKILNLLFWKAKILKSAKILNSGLWKAKILKTVKILNSWFWKAKNLEIGQNLEFRFINIIIRSGIGVVFKRRIRSLFRLGRWICSYSVLKESNALNFALYFAKINILNEECKWECFFVEFARKI